MRSSTSKVLSYESMCTECVGIILLRSDRHKCVHSPNSTDTLGRRRYDHNYDTTPDSFSQIAIIVPHTHQCGSAIGLASHPGLRILLNKKGA